MPSKANGICLCTGSLGVRAENDLPAMAKRFASRIGFAHLRATKREADGLSFFEADHLDGDVDMIAVLKALLAEDRRRAATDQIVFRPDHGHRMLDDLQRNQADKSRLYRDRPAARPRRITRRNPRHRACRSRLSVASDDPEPRSRRGETCARARLTHPKPSSSLPADTGAEKNKNDRQTENVADA